MAGEHDEAELVEDNDLAGFRRALIVRYKGQFAVSDQAAAMGMSVQLLVSEKLEAACKRVAERVVHDEVIAKRISEMLLEELLFKPAATESVEVEDG